MFWEIQLSTKAWRHKTFYSHQCPFYIGAQSYWLSFSMVTILFMGFITSWSEVITLVQAVRITSYMNETILYFPLSSDSSYTMNSKNTLAQVDHLFSWYLSPFVLLQVIILLLKVQIPAYIEMNIPWLYFVNSFLIATIFWFNCHKLNFRDMALPVDPFVNWKCCFIPLILCNFEQNWKAYISNNLLICYYVKTKATRLIILQIGKNEALGNISS